MRTYEVVANEKWICWLHALSSERRRLVMDDELFYFDEWVAGRMTFSMILADARLVEYSF